MISCDDLSPVCRMIRPKVTASLVENLWIESTVSSSIRVSSSDLPSSKTMDVCRFGLIQTRPCCTKIEVPERRHVVHHHVVDGVDVGVVAREEDLLGRQAAADLVAALDERDLETGFGEIGGGDQAVRAGADDDDIPVAFRAETRRRSSGGVGCPMNSFAIVSPSFANWTSRCWLARSRPSRAQRALADLALLRDVPRRRVPPVCRARRRRPR